jgi:hypothetical protein
LAFCARGGVAFIERSSLTRSSASQALSAPSVIGLGRSPRGSIMCSAAIRSAWPLASVNLHVCNLCVRNSEIALPTGIPEIGLGQAIPDHETIAIGGRCPSEIALCDQNIADLLVRQRETLLPITVCWIGLRESVFDREAVAMRLQSTGEIALRDLNLADSLVWDRKVALSFQVTGIGFGKPRSSKMLQTIMVNGADIGFPMTHRRD